MSHEQEILASETNGSSGARSHRAAFGTPIGRGAKVVAAGGAEAGALATAGAEDRANPPSGTYGKEQGKEPGASE